MTKSIPAYKVDHACVQCGATFQSKKKIPLFCSHACYHANRRKNATENVNAEFTHIKPVNANFVDLTGQRFGRLVVVRYLGRPRNSKSSLSTHSLWECLCDCGKTSRPNSQSLRKGKTKSCGCWIDEFIGNQARTHGMSKSPEYISYHEARKRCQNPKVIRYPQYGGRGIEFRFESFEEFLAELGRKPSPQHSLNRIDNDGHYEKGNVEWATAESQSRNKTSSHSITVNGSTHVISDWAVMNGIDVRLIDARLRRLGWCEPCAVSLKNGQRCVHRSK